MDLNHLYFEHQILRMQADGASSSLERILHDRSAALIAGRIGCMQRAMGAAAATGWTESALRDPDRTGMPQPLIAGPVRGPTPIKDAILAGEA